MRLDLSAQARRDIELLHQYGIRTFGSAQADRYTSGLLDLLELVKTSPEIARVRPEFSRKTRLIKYKSHVAFYRIDGDIVWIVRVLHGKQDWKELL